MNVKEHQQGRSAISCPGAHAAMTGASVAARRFEAHVTGAEWMIFSKMAS
ncbi:hypothetical protein [Saccharopolyspora rosea]|uniref:Uncharacterized protein n=1 Tax=Saccharopolyspora rosea TaxID=524884 RepID=A0ABW3G190_9PSEU|nr:hypothetical protein [Saccharopolyspora rosea]